MTMSSTSTISRQLGKKLGVVVAIMPISLALAAFSRWRVERSFQDGKQKLGMDHYEGRTYAGLIRPLLLCSLAYYFLQVQWLELSKKRSVDVLPGVASGRDGIDGDDSLT